MLWVLLALYSAIVYVEVPSLVKNRMYKELGVFGLVFIIGVYMTLAQLYEWPLPNPFGPWIQMLAYLANS
jgi:hypothetical protein